MQTILKLTHTHTHARMHARTHARMHTQTHTDTHTDTHTELHDMAMAIGKSADLPKNARNDLKMWIFANDWYNYES